MLQWQVARPSICHALLVCFSPLCLITAWEALLVSVSLNTPRTDSAPGNKRFVTLLPAPCQMLHGLAALLPCGEFWASCMSKGGDQPALGRGSQYGYGATELLAPGYSKASGPEHRITCNGSSPGTGCLSPAAAVWSSLPARLEQVLFRHCHWGKAFSAQIRPQRQLCQCHWAVCVCPAVISVAVMPGAAAGLHHHGGVSGQLG